jgi:hypothetical protein
MTQITQMLRENGRRVSADDADYADAPRETDGEHPQMTQITQMSRSQEPNL